MAQLLVRNIEEDVRDKLREQARRNGRSMEAEARDILRGAVAKGSAKKEKFGTRISRRFAKDGLTDGIRELRGNTILPPGFDQ